MHDVSRADYFFELFRDLPQQGPGSDASTARALALLDELGAAPRILDVGCGSGRQTLVLAERTGGEVVAVDVHEESLDRLRRAADERGLAARIDVRVMSMEALDFAPASFDLIWSEGAIYHLGFGAGLEAWRPLLREGGLLAVSELTWTREPPPPRVADYFATAYPGMGSLASNRRRTVAAGYVPVGGFVLPEEDWWHGYYTELESRVAARRPEATDEDELAVLREIEEEIDVFRRREGSYDYVFYLMRRGG
ncbi:MAG: methyltransferase domain-containing protein [Thermoanaerobaculia bacterium]|nr:methyltransferase domain-containing protein [Thermoanaerobaculia bacterium]